MINRAYFPVQNDPWLLRILSRLNLDKSLTSHRLQVKPVPNSEVDNCFFNVRNYVNSNGGEIIFGWALWKLELFFVEAEHHAVFRSIDSSELQDITPSSDSGVNYRSFIIDQNSKYDFDDDKKRLNNIRVPIYDHPAFYRLIELHKKKGKILDK